MKLVGYKRSDFTTKDGARVTGFSVFLASPVDEKRGKGEEVERIYLTDNRIKAENIDLDEMLNKQVRASYTRFGKISTLTLAE